MIVYELGCGRPATEGRTLKGTCACFFWCQIWKAQDSISKDLWVLRKNTGYLWAENRCTRLPRHGGWAKLDFDSLMPTGWEQSFMVSRCFTMFHGVSRCFTMFHDVSRCFTVHFWKANFLGIQNIRDMPEDIALWDPIHWSQLVGQLVTPGSASRSNQRRMGMFSNVWGAHFRPLWVPTSVRWPRLYTSHGFVSTWGVNGTVNNDDINNNTTW